MKLLLVCLAAVVVTTTGTILCEGAAQNVFRVGFLISLGGSVLLLLSGSFK